MYSGRHLTHLQQTHIIPQCRPKAPRLHEVPLKVNHDQRSL